MTYPKVELHCHMDGAIPNRLFVKYCREDGLLDETISDEEWIRKHVMSETMTLSECMGEFALLTNLLQSEERLEELSFELLKDMYESGTKLVELRFSPQSHINDHMTMEQAVQAVLRGRKKALEVYPDLVCGFLLCMMNLGQDLGTIENNTRTILLARKYKKDGVVGIDLAGDECATPIEGYAPQFELAKRLGVNYTIHAGESGNAANVAFAISMEKAGAPALSVVTQEKAFTGKPDEYICLTLAKEQNGDYVLHIRDSAPYFNPLDMRMGRLNAQSQEELLDSVGVMLVRKRAKDFHYRNYQGFNVMTVTI